MRIDFSDEAHNVMVAVVHDLQGHEVNITATGLGRVATAVIAGVETHGIEFTNGLPEEAPSDFFLPFDQLEEIEIL